MDSSLFHIQLVIFDCDGTLVDSLAGIASVMNVALRQAGLAESISSQQVGDVVGLSMAEAMQTLFPAAPFAQREEAVDLYKTHYQRLADAGTLVSALYPGVREVLDRLREQDIQLAMATGKSMRGVKRTLTEHRLQGYFRYLKSADCAPSKPDPGMVLQIIEESEVSPAAILMVGDTDFDLIMGRAAGVSTCAVTYGYHARARLAAARPNFWLEHMAELPVMLGLA